MKKAIVPALALLLISAAAGAQLKEPQKGVTAASSKIVTHKPTGTVASVSPKKTPGTTTVTTTKTVTKTTGIKRKHPRKAKKSKAKAKKM